jgi:hypothetical protein
MVLATMPSTLSPSRQLIQKTCEKLGKPVLVDSILCQEARDHLDAGAPDRHDEILKNEIENALSSYDLVILAQASMARVCGVLSETDRHRVLTSPPIAVESIRKRYF